jgi:hypothetical protein
MAFPAPAAVRTEPSQSTSESPRALNDHVFQPPQVVPGPFVTTAFGSITYFAYGDSRGPRFDINGNQVGTRFYQLGGFGQGFDYSLRLTPDLGVRAAVQGIVYAGINKRSALVAGAAATYDVRLGLTYGRNLGTWRGAFVLDTGVRPEINLLVANAVIEAIRAQRFGDFSPLDTISRFFLTPGISLAWAPHPALGFVGEGRFLWVHRTSGADVSDDRFGIVVSGSGELDFDPLIGVPLGVQGFYRLEAPVGGTGITRTQDIGAALTYTGRVRLQLGLEVARRTTELHPEAFPSLDLNAIVAAIRLRYYW